MGGKRRSLAWTAWSAALAAQSGAHAQSVNDNVTLQSDDAFGRSVGGEKTGLYNSDEVRGFNPTDAGNVRIEGIYIDLIDRLPGRLRPSETIRVGLSSQRFPFPAPTGLVDYELVDVGATAQGHVQLEWAGYNSPGGRVSYKLPIAGERLGLFAGGGYRILHRFEGGTSTIHNYAVMAQSNPYEGAEISAYLGGSGTSSEEARPTFFQTGDVLPPQIPRRKFFGQKWAQRDWRTPVWGVLTKLPFGDWRFEGGLFHMQRNLRHSYADILTDISTDPLTEGRAASRRIVADAGSVDKSLSGEMRLVRAWDRGALQHSLTASLRGRHKERLFGGSQSIDLGPSWANREDFRDRPNFTLGPKSHDDVKQLTYGLAYNLYWTGHANFDASLSKTHYTKRVDFADPAVPNAVTRDSPMLWNIDASFAITKRLTLFAGVSHGQEEALVAPDVAANRDEAPPAIHTRQVEAGIRYAITPHLGLVVGGFGITKPYYNLDPSRRFRKLGTIRNRGIEVSLTGQLAPGLTVVAGTLFFDPRISGEAVDAQLIGPRPVGQTRRRSVGNLDWRPDGGKSPLSFDLAVESFASRIANTRNTLSAPAHTNFNLGARFRFTIGKVKFLLRPQTMNLFNTYAWNVSPSGGFTYVQSRAFDTSLFLDF